MEKIGLSTLLLLLFLVPVTLLGQSSFAPAAGEPGSTAIYKDSSVFKTWASQCLVNRGYINIEDTSKTFTQGDITSNKAFFGNDTLALGQPNGIMDVVSLGDGGSATITFKDAMINDDGPDFAIFENGFKQSGPPYLFYLELAFVEVSSDGNNFVRFPSVSLTQDTSQINSFGGIDPENIHNLAGKYIVDYGTPFDLEDLKDSSNIDINNITHIKIVDVVGDVNDNFANYDSKGNKINDTWPTPFWSCGFDLEAVGIINLKSTDIKQTENLNLHALIYPNPIKQDELLKISINNNKNTKVNISIININGKLLYNQTAFSDKYRINTSMFSKGIYLLKIISDNKIFTNKFIVY
ncbi:MAG: T9SS type A sorting domain-containing protein [Bacteroidetes bacterium]|nr:T9SS type A sorting domain-containing protein [Bacteroidota bacterium]